MPSLRSVALVIAVIAFATAAAVEAQEPTLPVGCARVDITPAGPVRLSGYGARTTESDGVATRLYARALAIGGDDEGPVALVAVDACTVDSALTDALARRLQGRTKVDRAHLAVAASHSHTAPMLGRALGNLFSAEIPADQQQRIDAHTAFVLDRLEQAVLAALAARAPGTLGLARGEVGFARNRRTQGGPVDHDLPVLRVLRADGSLAALVANYACHCTTLGPELNRTCGDWAGFAAAALEEAHPGCVAAITIGCGADQDPHPRTGLALAERHGRELAAEVERLQPLPWLPVRGPVRARYQVLDLPLKPLPSRERWTELAGQPGIVGYHARMQLRRLERGEALRTAIALPVQSFAFGDDLAIVLLGGEVVVDYALRLRRELDRERLWLTAYANDVPGYVPSERVLREGGYEGGDAMRYYDQPGPFGPGLEQRIVDAVKTQLGEAFRPYAGIDPSRTEDIPPRDPARARESIRVPDGLRVELLASEPLLESPVWIDFGIDGRLFVCEYRDYPDPGEGVPKGRIRCLFDRDRDGRFDDAKVFLDDLAQPTGVTVWREGVLVCTAPDVLFAADRDGDGVADERRVLLRGFAVHNSQARVNSLTFGLDGFLYGAGGLFGGRVEVVATGAKVNLESRDFRFDPDRNVLQSATGRAQFGRPRDDFGNWFGCHSTGFLQHYPLADHYLASNVAPPPFEVDVAGADGGLVSPISRQPERFNDLQLLGRTTAACGATIYRDERLGPAFAGAAFCCDPVSNVVHCIALARDGVSFAGTPLRPGGHEFLASTDFWFRPVQAVTGPDGGLWVVDMARFLTEHPVFVPPERLAKIDTRAGDRFGRIWRIVRADAVAAPLPDLTRATDGELAELLQSTNGTLRDRAHQLLLWRDARSVAGAIEAVAASGSRPQVRLQAMCVLDAFSALSVELLRRGLGDADAGLRANAVRLGERRFGGDPELLTAVLGMVGDPEPQVRLQVASSLGATRDPRVGEALAALLRADALNPWIRAAVMSSAPPHLDGLLPALASATELTPAERFTLLGSLLSISPPLVAATMRTSSLAGVSAAARAAVVDGTRDEAERIAAVALLRGSREADDRAALLAAFRPETPDGLLRAVGDALARFEDQGLPDRLLAGWGSFGPGFRAAVLELLCQRPAYALALLSACARVPEVRQSLDAARRQLLSEHADERVASRARDVFGSVEVGRAQVLQRYADLDVRAGVPERGASVFASQCATCHRLGGEGRDLGPDLAALRDKSTAALVLAILDPNRAVLDRYLQYVLTTVDGRTLTGRIESESSSAVALVTADGARVSLLRSEIRSQASSGRSLMPEGLEAAIDRAAMADLLAFLQQPRLPRKVCEGNAPATVAAGAGGEFALTAAVAEIYGGDIAFEPEFGNLGYWHGEGDHAAWTVEVQVAATFAVELEWACAESAAGNRYTVVAGASRLEGSVAATGPAWDRYRRERIGELQLPAGRTRVELRPVGSVRGALLDLRAIHLLPR